MTEVLCTLGFAVLLLLPIFLGVGFLQAANWSRRNRKNPLVSNLRRPPGGTVHRKLQGAFMNLMTPLAFLSMAVSMPASIYLFQSHVLDKPDSVLRIVLTCLVGILICLFSILALMKEKRRASSLALGYECELAVGQELDQLMLKGFRVFHDLEGNGFNIDHVLVSPGGVFAIETKGRSKLLGTAGKKKASPKVQFSNGVFEFPKGYEKDWVDQARRQATWLRDWLSKAVGIELFVQPIVVVAGWYVETKAPHQVKAIGSGQIGYFFDRLSVQPLNEEQVGRIAYQLDQRTRDLEPGTVRMPLED
jgi:hypothetical protein